MTFKIERYTDGHHTTLRLIGYLQAEYLEELQAQIERNGPRIALDLDEVTLVDVEVCASSASVRQKASHSSIAHPI